MNVCKYLVFIVMLFVGISFGVAHAASPLMSDGRPIQAENAPLVKPDMSAIVHQLMEAYPDALQVSLELRDRDLARMASDDRGQSPESVFRYARRWPQRRVVKVAFMGGNPQAHKAISDVAVTWSMYCNLRFDFGLDVKTGKYRSWGTDDRNYAADIRISFDRPGYWSLVGTDSIDSLIGEAKDADGGRPYQRSMNLQGFDKFTSALTGYAAATVLHEFGHSLGLEHEHQHPTEGCNMEFRWLDDPGYVPARDSQGQFVEDSQGHRPGIYTALGGPPNRWPKWKVDANLRQLSDNHAYHVNAFDKKSIMKYFFEDWMFVRGCASPCFSAGVNMVLSDGDKESIGEEYPTAEGVVAREDLALEKAGPVDRDLAERVKGTEARRMRALDILINAEGATDEWKAHYRALKAASGD